MTTAVLTAERILETAEEVLRRHGPATAIFDATVAFHHPAHTVRWELPGQEEAFGAVVDIAVRGALGNRRVNDLETPPLPRRLE